MSERETRVESFIQKWGGVNERIGFPFLNSGTVQMATGVMYGRDGVLTKLEGKKIFEAQDSSVISIGVFSTKKFIVQLNGELIMYDTEDAINVLSPPNLGELDFTFSSFGDAGGVFYFLGKGLDAFGMWRNPAGKFLTINPSSEGTGTEDKSTIVDRKPSTFYTEVENEAYVEFDLGVNVSVQLSDLIFQLPETGGVQPHSLMVAGSNDQVFFDELYRTNFLEWDVTGWKRLSFTSEKFYRYIRVYVGQSTISAEYVVEGLDLIVFDTMEDYPIGEISLLNLGETDGGTWGDGIFTVIDTLAYDHLQWYGTGETEELDEYGSIGSASFGTGGFENL